MGLFVKNEGQIVDQTKRQRADIQFSVLSAGFQTFLKADGHTYQIERPSNNKTGNSYGLHEEGYNLVYRIDAFWKNSKPGNVIVECFDLTKCELNFYLHGRVTEKVATYQTVRLKNVYAGIDIKYYFNDSQLKYDFEVAPFADCSQIKMEIHGADLKLQSDGSVTLITPIGSICEGAPVAFQNGKKIHTEWKISENVLSLLVDDYDRTQSLIIDPPTRIWGSYYGGSGNDYGYATTTDNFGNVYLGGHTTSAGGSFIATTGAFQQTLAAQSDGFVAKFDSNGNRLWATYFGDHGYDAISGIAVDKFQNVFVVGRSTSSLSTGLTTSMVHQTNYGGGTSDAFLAKFDLNGVRVWATFYGGFNEDAAHYCVIDSQNNIYITGASSSTNGISAPAAQQGINMGTNDAFLAKFTSSGNLIWGTYYGAANMEESTFVTTDFSDNVYISGNVFNNSSSGNTLIATPGCHQSASGGNTDGFLAKYNPSGNLLWSTFYGGSQVDDIRSCVADNSGNIYIVGYTYSSNNISMNGFQNSPGGSEDAFVAKFNPSGVRLWGTYYGGAGFDEGYCAAIDPSGNLIISGMTSTSNSSIIATSSAFQTMYAGGGFDAMIVKFSPTGSRIWGTYYGGSGDDRFHRVCINSVGEMYACGTTNSQGQNIMATSNGHQSFYAGGFIDAVLVKFEDCNDVNPAVAVTVNACDGDSVTISSPNFGTVNWYNSSAMTNPIGSGQTYVTPTLGVGNYAYYFQVSTCSVVSSNSVIVNVNSLPNVTANSGSVCAGKVFTVLPTGAQVYKYSLGSQTIIPIASMGYTLWGVSPFQCVGEATASITVIPPPQYTISATDTVVCKGEPVNLKVWGSGLTPKWSTGSLLDSITVVPNLTTSYNVTVTGQTGCSASSSIKIYVNICTLEHNSLNDEIVLAYPNPFSECIIIDMPAETTYSIYSATGQLLQKESTAKNKEKLCLTDWDKGIYFLVLEFDNHSRAVKLIKN